MVIYIVRRILLMFPTLLGVTMVVFFVMALSPGGVGGPALNMDQELKADQRKGVKDYYEKRYGLNKPIVVQYLRWLNQVSPIGLKTDPETMEYKGFGLKMPDMGKSWSRNRPVVDLFAEALPITLVLNLMTLPLVYGLSISSGVLASLQRGKLFDSVSNVVLLVLYSIPSMWAGVMLLGYLANQQNYNWFPNHGFVDSQAYGMPFLPGYASDGTFVRGYVLDVMWHLCLPMVVMTYASFTYLSKLTRSSMLENLSSDFARTARAKGVPETQIVMSHVFRNSLIPLITILAGLLPSLFGGSMIIEKIFSLPGTGSLSIEAVLARDREVIMASTLILGIIGMLCRLASDIGYTIADPRVSYE
jgi:ABC-type dipeptide/oligopeptide/nickel transport system permease component